MKALASRLSTNIIYGAIALLPVAALIYILAKLFGFLKKLSEPLAPYLSSNTYLNTLLLIVLTLVTLLALCYLFGALINTRLGAMSFKRIEKRLRDFIPGYEIIAGLLRGIAGHEMSFPPALVTLSAPGTAVLGFVMEDEGDEYLTIFVPTAPVMTAGAIHIIERSRVQLIDVSSMEAANCVTQWGMGLKKLRGSTLPPKLA
jgi:uncharacterized membrane protein